MAGLINSPTPGGTQQQAIIDAVARRQYGRWAAQYRAANLRVAAQRDADLARPEPPPAHPAPAPTTAQRLLALQDLRAAGVITQEEFARFKASVLDG